MKIKWLGHAAFLLTSDGGTKVLTDPYKSGCFDGAVACGRIMEKADVVTVSHAHDDHNGLEGLPSGYEAVTAPGKHTAAGVEITSIKTFHDKHQGKERGRNIVHVITLDGIRVAHLGDLGHLLGDDEIQAIGKVDVVLIPVGGYFTIEPKEAMAVIRQLGPSVVLPMHYKTPSIKFPIKPVEDFLSLVGKHERPGKSEIELKQDSLTGQRVIVLEPAL